MGAYYSYNKVFPEVKLKLTLAGISPAGVQQLLSARPIVGRKDREVVARLVQDLAQDMSFSQGVHQSGGG